MEVQRLSLQVDGSELRAFHRDVLTNICRNNFGHHMTPFFIQKAEALIFWLKFEGFISCKNGGVT